MRPTECGFYWIWGGTVRKWLVVEVDTDQSKFWFPGIPKTYNIQNTPDEVWGPKVESPGQPPEIYFSHPGMCNLPN